MTPPAGYCEPPQELKGKQAGRPTTPMTNKAGFRKSVEAAELKKKTRLSFVTTITEERARSRSLVLRTTAQEWRKEDPRLRPQTGHRICQVEEARPQLTTNITGPRKFKCAMPAGSW